MKFKPGQLAMVNLNATSILFSLVSYDKENGEWISDRIMTHEFRAYITYPARYWRYAPTVQAGPIKRSWFVDEWQL